MLLTSADEVVRYVGATLRDALATAPPAWRNGGPARLRLGLVDPDCVLYIDTESREVRLCGSWDEPVTGMVAMRADTALRCCQGSLDLDLALAAGEIVTDGDHEALLELLSSGRGLTTVYADVLRREGRSDLLDRELVPAG